jgi:hypothetical protein
MFILFTKVDDGSHLDEQYNKRVVFHLVRFLCL